jgi:glycosyltransferase involved in cell wall biosynthesis
MTLISNIFVSVVVPLQNDADILESFFEELARIVRERWQNYEIVLVDDGSTDDTARLVAALLLKHECVRYLRLSRSFGVEVAILAGLDTVIGDVIVVIQPENDPPAILPAFVDKARAVNGIVYGLRSKSLREPLLYTAGRKLFTRLARSLIDVDLPERATLFMALTRQSLNAVIRIKDKSRALRIYSSYVGFAHYFLEYEPAPRRPVPRTKGISEGIERGMSLIVANSTRPLRIVSLLGLLMSFLNVAYIVYVFGIAAFKQQVAEGWITISLQHAFMFMFLFLILSILCEYVGRLLAETRDRPLYFVAEERTSSVMIRDEDRRNVVVEST